MAFERLLALANENLGLCLVVLSQFFNLVMMVTTKLLELDPDFPEPIHPLQILFARMSITYGFCLVYMKLKGVADLPFGPPHLRWLLVLRGSSGFFGVFGVYFSLQYLSVSDAVVITFLVPPATTLLAAVVLRERYLWREFVAGLVSFTGVILVARPAFLFGASAVDGNVETSDPVLRLWGVGVGLLGVVGAAIAMVTIRTIGTRAHPLLLVSYFAFICVVILFVTLLVHPSLLFVLPQTGRQWFLFILIGIAGFVMQFCLTEGIQRERAGRFAFMLYTQMVYAVFWELTIWHRIPPATLWLGFVIILVCAVSIVAFVPKETPGKDGDDEELIGGSGEEDWEVDEEGVELTAITK